MVYQQLQGVRLWKIIGFAVYQQPIVDKQVDNSMVQGEISWRISSIALLQQLISVSMLFRYLKMFFFSRILRFFDKMHAIFAFF